MSITIEQKIAPKEAELARLREQKRSLANGQKIILGGMVLSHAEKITDFRLQPLNCNIKPCLNNSPFRGVKIYD